MNTSDLQPHGAGTAILPLDEEIDYASLSDDNLEVLAADGDPYIATSALSTLRGRDDERTAKAAARILSTWQGDRHLQAAALAALFAADRPSALRHMGKLAEHGSPFMINEAMRLILSDLSAFESGSEAALAMLIGIRVSEYEAGPPFEPEVRDRFVDRFG